MIRINLLPYKVSRKIENIRRQVTVFLIAFAIIMSGMFYYNMTLTKKIENLNAQVDQINKDIKRVQLAAKKVDKIRKELEKLNRKIDVIKDLETKRKGAVRLMDSMTKMVVEKTKASGADALEGEEEKLKRLWFTNFQANEDDIRIKGIALDNRTVADFMTRLETSNLFTNVNLLRLKKQKIKKLNLKSFEISCTKVSTEKDSEDQTAKK
jgi:type IV pilus assembly protein PilN